MVGFTVSHTLARADLSSERKSGGDTNFFFSFLARTCIIGIRRLIDYTYNSPPSCSLSLSLSVCVCVSLSSYLSLYILQALRGHTLKSGAVHGYHYIIVDIVICGQKKGAGGWQRLALARAVGQWWWWWWCPDWMMKPVSTCSTVGREGKGSGKQEKRSEIYCQAGTKCHEPEPVKSETKGKDAIFCLVVARACIRTQRGLHE